jgi:uncharacterized membrane protein YcaP (DUF421 family)
MGNVILVTIVKGTIIYILALILTRKVGTKFISQMNFFDFVLGTSMGSIIAYDIIDKEFTSISATTTLILFSVLTAITAYVNIKSIKMRKLIDSEPTTLVENGCILDENMKKVKMSVNELKMKLREKSAFNLADVEFAIMETDGQISVLPKSDKKPITPYNLNIKTTSGGLERDIVIDGKVMEENLKGIGLDRKWLENELNKQKIKDVSEVFYAGVDNTKKLYVSKRHKINDYPGKYGI